MADPSIHTIANSLQSFCVRRCLIEGVIVHNHLWDLPAAHVSLKAVDPHH